MTGPAQAVIEATVEVGNDPIGIASGVGSLWVVNAEVDARRGTVSRIDPGSDEVLATVDGLLWVSCTDVDVVQAIDPSTNEVVATVETPIAPDGLAFDGTTLWVATEAGPELAGIDPVAREVVTEVVVAEEGVINANQVMVFEEGSLWLPIFGQGTVVRVEPPA